MGMKPYSDFPLFLHATGQWAKKIRGRTHYFGTDADAALKRYVAQRDDLHAGRTPRGCGDGADLDHLTRRFLFSKEQLRDSGELTMRTWSDYHAACGRLLRVFAASTPIDAILPSDFERLRADIAKTRGPISLGNEIQRVRTIFKFAFEDGLIERPARFGTGFKKPSTKTIRQARHATGKKMFAAAEVRHLIHEAGRPMKAMILLAINCGFGQSDLSSLPIDAIDFPATMVRFPRPKTGVDRCCPLWPETVDELRAAIASRATPKDLRDAGLVFLSPHGRRLVRQRFNEKNRAVCSDGILAEFNKLLVACKIKRPRIGFYALRHTFRTIADGSQDHPACDFIMGHARPDMASAYREQIDDARLSAVTNYVRTWLFADVS